MEKFHIRENSVQETLVIPLYGRVVAHRKFPDLINDPTAEEIIKKIDYDFENKGKKMELLFGVYGALEVSQREYDLEWDLVNLIIFYVYSWVFQKHTLHMKVYHLYF